MLWPGSSSSAVDIHPSYLPGSSFVAPVQRLVGELASIRLYAYAFAAASKWAMDLPGRFAGADEDRFGARVCGSATPNSGHRSCRIERKAKLNCDFPLFIGLSPREVGRALRDK